VSYLHLKSVDKEFADRVQREGIPFAEAVAQGVFVEPAKGVVDFRELLAAIDDVGYEGYAIIEQDMYPTDFGRPLPIAQRSQRYLSGLGL
jgi:inosose dehydratase